MTPANKISWLVVVRMYIGDSVWFNCCPPGAEMEISVVWEPFFASGNHKLQCRSRDSIAWRSRSETSGSLRRREVLELCTGWISRHSLAQKSQMAFYCQQDESRLFGLAYKICYKPNSVYFSGFMTASALPEATHLLSSFSKQVPICYGFSEAMLKCNGKGGNRHIPLLTAWGRW